MKDERKRWKRNVRESNNARVVHTAFYWGAFLIFQLASEISISTISWYIYTFFFSFATLCKHGYKTTVGRPVKYRHQHFLLLFCCMMGNILLLSCFQSNLEKKLGWVQCNMSCVGHMTWGNALIGSIFYLHLIYHRKWYICL